ncbi:hypothetical protein JH146_0091 [Methanocaldococcus bathoardescens]|uniref:Uncharacterized protein n=1 Tax=Methanocaldococcus bathoardescens TaxID=1301915 RepID=A0A076LDR8_9EURY|nr:hypothetical protein [Methanocaldococcus bathoardescens]AIJ04942.1 hypothetical protein JH146_0091 [Methanocaldococcus bathoardescens]
MAIAYAKLYELILKKVKDEKEAREIYDIIIELNKENKIIIKNELKDELRSELATKEDIKYLDEKIEKEIKLLRRDMIIIALIIILSIYAPEIIGKLLLFK